MPLEPLPSVPAPVTNCSLFYLNCSKQMSNSSIDVKDFVVSQVYSFY